MVTLDESDQHIPFPSRRRNGLFAFANVLEHVLYEDTAFSNIPVDSLLLVVKGNGRTIVRGKGSDVANCDDQMRILHHSC